MERNTRVLWVVISCSFIGCASHTEDGSTEEPFGAKSNGNSAEHRQDCENNGGRSGEHRQDCRDRDNRDSEEASETPPTAIPAFDTTPPTITFSGARAYAINEVVDVQCDATDDTGVTETTCSDVIVRASQLGAGTFTVSATARDAAGNQTTQTATYSVTMSGSGMCALVTSYVTNAARARQICLRFTGVDRNLVSGSTPITELQTAFTLLVTAKTLGFVSSARYVELRTLMLAWWDTLPRFYPSDSNARFNPRTMTPER